MKKTMRILLPILLAFAIIACMVWYLLAYDRAFARDMLLTCARFSERRSSYNISAMLYNCAYNLADRDSESKDQVAIELAEQYKKADNYTKAEYTLTKAIADGGGMELYIALCKTYIEQDKLYDAVTMLDNVKKPEIIAELNRIRPGAPRLTPDSGLYNQYISVAITSNYENSYIATGGNFPSVKDKPYADPVALTDGENIIYAVTIGDNGLVSPLTVGTYTIGGVIKELDFADEAIEAKVRELLNTGADRVLCNNDLWQITEFTVPADAKSYDDLKDFLFLTSLTLENGVETDLSFLSNMQNLTTLTIKNTVITAETVAAIGTLTTLKDLTLENCKVSNISGLSGATAVENLNLSKNAIADIGALANMTNLKNVNVEQNFITSVSGLGGLTSLKTLDISNNVLTSLEPLAGITTLVKIDAANNSISELGDLSGLTALEELNLSTNKLTGVAGIAKCTALINLNIAENSITDISRLSGLTNMEVFNFSHNQVSALPHFPLSCALVTIDGSYNTISTLETLSGLENLNDVLMDYNPDISSVKALADCHNLIEVSVYGTLVTEVSALTSMSVIVNYDPT